MPDTLPPRVSVVIPCYNGERYLRQAIESCLSQTLAEFEVIVVDDASPQGDAAIADEYARADPRVRVLRHPANRGVSEAFNTGFAAATGDYLTRLAQDDLFAPDAFAVMVAKFEGGPPGVGLVYCDMVMIDDAGKVLCERHACEAPARALLPANRLGNCVMWRRTVWEKVGPFRKAFDYSEDYDFYLRVLSEFRIDKCGDAAPFRFRWHAAQGSNRLARRQDVTMCRAQLAYRWRQVLRNPLDLTAWKGCVGRVARLPWLRLRAVRTPRR